MGRTKARRIVPSLSLRPDFAIEARLPNGPNLVLCGFWTHSSLRVGIEQEELAALDPVSGSSGALATICYEVGYQAFWLAQSSKRDIECLVIDPGSVQVNRRGRRVKTDPVDVKMPLRTLIAWYRGERQVWSLVCVPSTDEEDLRRSHRERS